MVSTSPEGRIQTSMGQVFLSLQPHTQIPSPGPKIIYSLPRDIIQNSADIGRHYQQLWVQNTNIHQQVDRLVTSVEERVSVIEDHRSTTSSSLFLAARDAAVADLEDQSSTQADVDKVTLASLVDLHAKIDSISNPPSAYMPQEF
ncbi:hypothetical protein L6452_26308 [Arctium lappa]|uniref:Uncharacterized protein n=1 Tax=Arctium lappa TaxID=4217 RepID=A0ACB9ADI3_ARCLA|nr:hypothetical protein L6452_26308 [Arctium lappa]